MPAERIERVGQEGGWLQDQPTADDIQAQPEGERERHVLQRQHPRLVSAEHDRGKADEPQQRHPANRAQKRHSAALPVGARRAEISKSDYHKGDRIKRRHQPIVQFGAELPGKLLVERI